MSAPVAAKTAWQETRHGTVVTDDYRWLQKKTDPAVIDYLNAENAYTAAVTAPIQPLADKVTAEIKGRMQEVDLSVPARQGNFYYYTRMEAGKQYPMHCRRPVGREWRLRCAGGRRNSAGPESTGRRPQILCRARL